MNIQDRYPYNVSASTSAILLSKVSYLLCTALLATAGAAYVARDMPFGIAEICGIGAIVCVFVLGFTRTVPGVNLLLLYGLSVLEGLSLGPILSLYARAYANGGSIISEAFTMTAAIVAGIGAYIWITNKDFGFLGKFLFWALIGLVIASFLSIFIGGLMAGHGELIYCAIGAAIFVGFTLYDFSNIKHRYGPDDYVMATVSLYLDFLNLFLFLLRILAILSGNGGRSRD